MKKNTFMKRVAITLMAAFMAASAFSYIPPVGVQAATKQESTVCNYTVKKVKKTMTVKSDVYVRKGPKTTYDIMGSYSKGKKVTVTGQVYKHGNKACWVQVKYKNKTGYVCTDYLK